MSIKLMSQQPLSLALAVGLAAVSGCSMVPEPTSAWTHWVCDSQVEVYWRPDAAFENGVELRLGAGEMLYHLAPQPAASGALYSDSVLALHTKGEQGLVYWVANNDLLGRDCKAPSK
jgi:hypothetical protein